MKYLSKLFMATAILLAGFTSLSFADLKSADAAYKAKKYEEAFIEYVKLAKDGDPIAEYNVGIMYQRGNFVKIDMKKAFNQYIVAAKAGYIPAYNNIGAFYENGAKGPEKNLKSAAKWYYQAAINGFPVGQFNYGRVLELGLGVEKNLKEAVVWYEKASKKNVTSATHKLARIYVLSDEVGKDPVRGFELMKKAANAGRVLAMYQLAAMYHEAIGTELNDDEAFKWYRASARLRLVPAIYSLAWAYYKGEGVKVSPLYALMFFDIAADRGHERAIKPRDLLKSKATQAELKLIAKAKKAWVTKYPPRK